MKWEESWV